MSPMIRFDNFKPQYRTIKAEIATAIERVLESGWFILGEEVRAFEREFAAYIGVRHAVGVASGTEAIALALMALDIGPGCEVITTNLTAFPTITGILQAGAKPVVVDIKPSDGLIDPTAIAAAITPATKALMPVHLYGQSCDLDRLAAIAASFKLHIIEDCAQSVGATFHEHKTGAIGTCGAFSFYPTKNLGAYGDAGAVVTNDTTLYTKLLELRNYGQTNRYQHERYGINSRLDEMQAAVLRVKLGYLTAWNARRLEIASQYQARLQTVTCLTQHSYGQPVYHLFAVKTQKRDQFQAHLQAAGIQTLIHYPIPVNRQSAFLWQKDDALPATQQFAAEIVSIPIYPELSAAEIELIVEAINAFH